MSTLLGGYGDSVNSLNILRLYHFVFKYFIERVFVFISDGDRRVIKVAGIEVSNKSILLTYILTLKTQSITKKTPTKRYERTFNVDLQSVCRYRKP